MARYLTPFPPNDEVVIDYFTRLGFDTELVVASTVTWDSRKHRLEFDMLRRNHEGGLLGEHGGIARTRVRVDDAPTPPYA